MESAFAIWRAGAALVPMQVPLRTRDPAILRRQLEGLLEAAGCSHVLAHARFACALPEDVAIPWNAKGELSSEEPAGATPDSTAVIQFTSGSTAAPRGARVTHEAVIAQMEVLDELNRDGARVRSSANWTPFFHDLGLFLNVLPAAMWGLVSHHLPTDLFAREPGEWLRLIDRTRAAVTITPSAAFGRAINAVRGEKVSLASLEAVRFAAEGADPQVIRRSLESAPRLELRPQALGSSYGLAEAVLAVCYTSPGAGLTLDRVSLEGLAGQPGVAEPTDVEPARLLAACGKPKMDIRIRGADGDLPERGVGEILLRGRSLMSGYVGPGAEDPFDGEWMRTGDLGYLSDGELFVTGRIKDMMIAMGLNYYPEDFEWAAARVDGVRAGRCVAFNPPGTEEVVVLAEARNGATDRLKRQVQREIVDSIGVTPGDVVMLNPNTVQKTTSGKLRRATMRDRYLSGALAEAEL